MNELDRINQQIADVQARIAAKNAGMPQRNTPEYRAARFDYIVDGDRSGLDAYNTAVANAIQNRLNRESTMELAKFNKQQVDEEGMDQWQKDYTFAKNAQREIDNNPKSTQKDKDDAAANVRYYEAVGRHKGYAGRYAEYSAPAPAQESTPAPAATVPASAPVNNWATDSANAQKVIDTDTSTLEDIAAAEKALQAYANKPEVAEDLGKLTSGLSNKRNKIDTTEKWKLAQEKARAEIDRKGVKISDIDAQMKAIKGFEGQEGYDKLMTELKNKKTALTPKDLTPLKKAVKQAWSDNALKLILSEMRREGKKERQDNVTVDGKTVGVKIKLVGDKLIITNDKGNNLREYIGR